ncbi:class I SAM-dependent RNA methyltransferase [Roseovarius aestuariivivens]|uniref:class I SAM-dependent RNA methyltransferase n=1 Tax=Roseovarius aestuariivivens TaxID=1888910 RepID=UPI001080C8E9|nr:RsmD family RNA methyltransferase [Roseovarius aestuariivivens]
MAEIDILRLGHRGDGIADGPVYAPLTLPGERISGDLDGQVLRNPKIVTSSPDRVAPPCRHFKSCGGCQLQHASDGFVAAWKTEIVARALSAHGLETTLAPIFTVPPASRRRATLSARRTKKGALAGFHARASDVVVEIPDCRLLEPDLLRALPVAEALAIAGGSRKGELSVAATLSETGLDLQVIGGKPLDGPLRVALAALADTHDLARLTWEDEVIVTRRPPEQVFGDIRVVPPPGAFLQATKASENTLIEAVQSLIGPAGHILDLFSGCGTFALPLSRIARVHAVEGDADMLRALDQGWRMATRVKPLTTEARDLFRQPLIAAELDRFDAVVLDPPRAGAEAQVRELAQAAPGRIAYVSCNPVTFARDAAILCAGAYTLDQVRPVDQFRWSSHVELVAQFTQKSSTS